MALGLLVDFFVTGGWESITASPLSETERRVGCVMARPAFAAPEQIQFTPQEVVRHGLGRLADVHGIGATMYSLLYDCPPNLPEARALPNLEKVVQAILARKGAPSPGQLRPTLKASPRKGVRMLERIALKALEADPRRRYQTVAEMVEELEECLRSVSHQRSRWSLRW